MTPLEKGKLYTPKFRDTGGRVHVQLIAFGYHDAKLYRFCPEDRILYLWSEDIPDVRTGTSPDSPCRQRHIFLYGETTFICLQNEQLESWVCIDQVISV